MCVHVFFHVLFHNVFLPTYSVSDVSAAVVEYDTCAKWNHVSLTILENL